MAFRLHVLIFVRLLYIVSRISIDIQSYIFVLLLILMTMVIIVIIIIILDNHDNSVIII